MIRRPPRSTRVRSSAASDVYKRQNMDLVDAQQARRILDRLVGYGISPLLWKKVKRGLSAGRVQTAALRIVVEREREIDQFESVEYWTIDADLAKQVAGQVTKSDQFRATLNLSLIHISEPTRPY